MRAVAIVCQIVGTIALSFLLFVAGYFACSQPITTNVLAQSTSTFESSPYTLDDLSSLAVAGRTLTVDARPQGTNVDDARKAFNESLMLAATHSSERYLASNKEEDAQKAELWKGLLKELDATAPTQVFTLEDVNATAARMAAHSTAFALDEDAYRHLDDCNTLINTAMGLVIAALLMLSLCLVVLLVLRQWRDLGRMFVIAPVLLLVVFLALGIWAVLNFHGFFAAFHSLFFPQGNWTFAYDSLLISMYPSGFWMAMGFIWLVTSVLASILVLMLGRWIASFGR